MGKSFEHAKRTMIIGGGDAGQVLISEIIKAKQTPYEADKYAAQFEPVCIIDNDPKKLGTEIMGIKVVGTSSDIPQVARRYKIDQIILAIPSLPEENRKLIIDLCNETKLPLKIVPFIGTLILEDNMTLLGQVRDIKTEELLGRDPVTFNNKNIMAFVHDKVCMVTGGGGSIGSELVR